MLPIDEGLKAADSCRLLQGEHILGLDGNGVWVGVRLEDDDLWELGEQTRR